MKKRRASLGEIFSSHRRVERALRRAVAEALLRHAALGESVVEWRRGKIVWVAPEKIPVRLRQEGFKLKRRSGGDGGWRDRSS